MHYVTYSELFTFVLIIIALLTYLDNKDIKHKKKLPPDLAAHWAVN
jgi:hypothetical protein